MAGPRIRVLVVDDSVVVRRLVADALSSDAGIEVVGTAANGRIALQKIPQVNPDLVTLDMEMPELDGLGTLVEIRKTWPALPVIMFSGHTERSAAATIDALSRGASDYVTQPADTVDAGGIDQELRRIRAELIPRIHALCPPAAIHPALARQPDPAGPPRGTATGPVGAARNAGAIDVVAIGVSTGGAHALAALIPGLPRTLGVPVVITQHMPPLFTRLLAARLDSPTGLRVREGEEGMLLEPGTAVIAPGDRHMVFVRKGTRLTVHLTQEQPENARRPAVDVMFRSIVAHFGGATLGVILTGMGQDGLRGCELVRAAGGHVLVQDEASSVVWGMPGFVARAGLADDILPLEHMAVEIARHVRYGAGVPARRA
jgi:two-component system, chemotaxis family, protein-glutamate methylesterase/glutaminase